MFKVSLTLPFVIASVFAGAPESRAQSAPPAACLAPREMRSPHIEGDRLIIDGRIDSHVYDYLSYDAKAVATVKTIELNSCGGNSEWGLRISEKIAALGKTTRVPADSYCASICAPIFAAGRERELASTGWIGVHGARLGGRYPSTFAGLCFNDYEDGSVFEPRKAGCKAFLEEWTAAARRSTDEMFDLMEKSGPSARLRQTYWAMPDDPNWPAESNVLRKPDWTIEASEALSLGLATRVIN